MCHTEPQGQMQAQPGANASRAAAASSRMLDERVKAGKGFRVQGSRIEVAVGLARNKSKGLEAVVDLAIEKACTAG